MTTTTTTPAAGESATPDVPVAPEKKYSKEASAILDVRAITDDVGSAVERKSPRDVSRLLRQLFERIRPRLTEGVVAHVLSERSLADRSLSALAKRVVDDAFSSTTTGASAMEVESSSPPVVAEADLGEDAPALGSRAAAAVPVDDVRAVVLLLVALVALIDRRVAAPERRLALAGEVGEALVARVRETSPRLWGPLFPRIYFYYVRALELRHGGCAGMPAGVGDRLLAALQLAKLRGDAETTVSVLNLLLRLHLARRDYALADRLRQQAAPAADDAVSGNQMARYYYYLARIQAMQLDYAAAAASAHAAMLKCPQGHADGFRLAVTKLTVVVQLLRGEIPSRSVFQQPRLAAALAPYSRMVAAVYASNLDLFNERLARHAALFERDDTLALLQRVRTTVIKLGLRNMALAYSRIRLTDVAAKLSLQDAQDAECVVAHAIHDRVIDATLERDDAADGSVSMRTRELSDIYGTLEPREAFHARTAVCLRLYSDAVQAMHPLGAPPSSDPSEAKITLVSAEDLDLVEDEDDDDDLF